MRVPLKDLFKCPTKEKRLKGARIKHLVDQSIQTRSLSSEESPRRTLLLQVTGVNSRKLPNLKRNV